MTDHNTPDNSRFDLRARAELALAFEPGQPPARLLRLTPWWSRAGVRAVAALSVLLGFSALMLALLRPPELVREAIDHEYFERTLRGNFMAGPKLARKLGLAGPAEVPGYPQLMRPCEIGGRLVYHLTTFFEHGGMVTVFAFDRPVALEDGSGWWNNIYWQVVRSRDGRPLVMVSQQKKALAVARANLAGPPAS